jgi:hypothetical protein
MQGIRNVHIDGLRSPFIGILVIGDLVALGRHVGLPLQGGWRSPFTIWMDCRGVIGLSATILDYCGHNAEYIAALIGRG